MILTTTVREARELADHLQVWPALATALKSAATQATFTQGRTGKVTITIKDVPRE